MDGDNLTFLAEGGSEIGNNQLETGAGGGGEGDAGSGSGAGGSGAGGDGEGDFSFSDHDRPVVQSLRKVLGDKYSPENVSAILNMAQEVPRLRNQITSFESSKDYVEAAKFLSDNKGYAELVNYIRGGGTQVGLFSDLAKMDMETIRPEEALAFRMRFENGYSEQEVAAVLKKRYGIGEDVRDPLDEDYLVKQATLKSDGGAAKQWAREFKGKAMLPADRGESGPSLQELGGQWDPVIENAKKSRLDVKHEIVTPAGDKVPIDFQFLSNDVIEAQTAQLAKGLALELKIPATEQNQEIIFNLARAAAIGQNFSGILKSAMSAAAKAGMDHMSRVYSGDPGLGGGHYQNQPRNGELQYVGESGNQKRDQSHW